MSFESVAYHIERGATKMFPVDIAHAVGHHPFEWSRVPWTDEMKAEAGPKLREKRQAEKKAREDEQRAADNLGLYDPVATKVVSPIAGQTGQAPAGMRGEVDALTPPYAEDEKKAAEEQRAEDKKALDEKRDGQSFGVNAKASADNDRAVEMASAGKADKK